MDSCTATLTQKFYYAEYKTVMYSETCIATQNLTKGKSICIMLSTCITAKYDKNGIEKLLFDV